MGFRICYLAAETEPKAMARAFGLEITETTMERPYDNWWVARLVASGWSLLWSEDETYGERSRDLIASLSRETGVFHCEVNETVMWSSAAYWLNGEQVWRITHSGGDEGIRDLKTEGDLPLAFEAIRDKCFADQESETGDDEFACDYIFEIPLEVASASIEFRHDGVLNSADTGDFHVLKPAARPSLLSRLFGR